MKKLSILVPTDFSEISLKALRVAGELAGMTDGSVTPFFAFEKVRYDRTDASPETVKTDLDELAARYINPTYLRPAVVSKLHAAQAITEEANEHDLVIMSSHGRTGLTKLMLGSVTEKVIRLSKPPVLVVKSDAEMFPLHRILVTTDFSENARNSYGIAAKLAELTGASVHMVYAVTYHTTEPATHLDAYIRTKDKKFKVHIQKYFSAVADRVSFQVTLTRKSAHEFLTNHIAENSYNLVVMATLGRTGLSYLKMGSTTGSVVRHTDTNLLVTNAVTGTDWNEVAEQLETQGADS